MARAAAVERRRIRHDWDVLRRWYAARYGRERATRVEGFDSGGRCLERRIFRFAQWRNLRAALLQLDFHPRRPAGQSRGSRPGYARGSGRYGQARARIPGPASFTTRYNSAQARARIRGVASFRHESRRERCLLEAAGLECGGPDQTVQGRTRVPDRRLVRFLGSADDDVLYGSRSSQARPHQDHPGTLDSWRAHAPCPRAGGVRSGGGHRQSGFPPALVRPLAEGNG